MYIIYYGTYVWYGTIRNAEGTLPYHTIILGTYGIVHMVGQYHYAAAQASSGKLGLDEARIPWRALSVL